MTEDRGDTLHDQLNKLDSIWAYKLNQQHPDQKYRGPIRRAWPGSNGRRTGKKITNRRGCTCPRETATIDGLIGTKEFRKDRARLFFTQQHGENNLFEVFPLD